MSWWVGMNRSELNAEVATRVFSQKKTMPNPNVPEQRVFRQKPGRPRTRTNPYEYQKKYVLAYQAKNRALGLCESGDGNPTEINPKTGKNYRRCKACAAKRSKYDAGRARGGKRAGSNT